MIGTHALTADQFAALATSGGDAETIHQLRRSQLSKNIVLIHAIMQTAAESFPDEFDAAGFADGLTLLEETQRRAPDTVAELLVHPQVGAWAGQCLRRLLGVATRDQPLTVQLGHLGAIAAAAAIRAGHPFVAAVPMDNGRIMLPALGLCTVDTQLPDGIATIRSDGHYLTVTAPHGQTVHAPLDLSTDGHGWQALRRLTAETDGLRLSLDFDDLGPYRDGGEMSVADRVADDAIGRWQELLDEAWHLLATVYPDRAESMIAGLATLIPMVPGGDSPSKSATSRDAFGAVMLTLPEHPILLAETLVHEFQHSKLDAVLDLLPLYEAGESELFYSPARDDPRPLGGMLQGAYAYAGVADFWRRYQAVGNNDHARMEFASWREQVARVSQALLDSGRLTPCGVDFVTGMRAQMRHWDDTDLSSEQRAVARDAADDHHVRWRLNNVYPDPGEVSALAYAWLRGTPAANQMYVAPPPRPAPQEMRINPRLQLRQLKELNPPRFAEVRADPAAAEETGGGSAADFAYLSGEPAQATALYLAQIRSEPENIEHWAGLLLARRQIADDAASRALRSRPELVRAVYLAVRTEAGAAPDPEALAAWLDGVGAPARPATLGTGSGRG